MKLITAIVRPDKLEELIGALIGNEAHGLTVTEVRGFGRQGGHTETYRGTEYQIDFVPKVKIEVICEDGQVDAIVEAIMKAAHTGKIGDGKIVVTTADEVHRIRTGEAGPDAI